MIYYLVGKHVLFSNGYIWDSFQQQQQPQPQQQQQQQPQPQQQQQQQQQPQPTSFSNGFKPPPGQNIF